MLFWGVDLGGTAIKVGLLDEQHRIKKETEGLTPVGHGSQVTMDRIAELCLSLGRADAVGVGTPGTVNPLTGEVLYCNNLHWSKVQLAQGLQDRLGVPCRAANDASLAALAENALGATRGAQCAAVVTLGTGVGAGITVGGRLWVSPCGAPEFGHTTLMRKGGRPCTCGRRGCLETYCSAKGLRATADERLGTGDQGLMPPFDGQVIFQAAFGGHEGAKAVVNRWLDDLAEGMGNLANAYRPEVIAFGGGLTKGGDWFLHPLAARMKRYIYGVDVCGMPRLTLCSLGWRAGIIGAALWAHAPQY